MKEFINEVRTSIKKLNKTNLERLRLLLLFVVTIGTIALGVYALYYVIINGLKIALIFIGGMLNLWFGIGMLDMLRDMVKFNK